MRPIEFRLWDKKYQKMGYFHLTETPFVSSALVIGGEITTDEGKGYAFQTRYEDEVSEWMQYTGIKDKHGTKIFEGDIISIESDEYCLHGEKKYITDIFFSKGAFRYRHRDGSGSVIDFNSTSIVKGYETITQDVIVLGNIYEHPHLLEKNK